MPDLTVKQHDTFPALAVVLLQGGYPLDLSTASSIKFNMKGTGALVTGAMTKATVASITANVSAGASQLTGVSSFVSVVTGGSILGAGIPAGARVGRFDTSAQIIEMIDATGNSITATADGAAVALTINRGTATYAWQAADLGTADSYNLEFEVTWPEGKQTIPNDGYNTILVKNDLDNA